ncbi:retrovirus-related pol polyprotein from transposon TNT 1-94 [Tanacetum coccineum]
MSQVIMNIVVSSCVVRESMNMSNCIFENWSMCLELETEPFKQTKMVEKDVYDKLVKDYLTLEKHFISIESSHELRYEDREEIKKDIDEIDTQTIEMEHRVVRLKNENDHLKQTYKNLFDSIKKACAKNNDQSASLMEQINKISVENDDLKAQIQDKVFVITSLKNELPKVKGKDVVKTDASKSKATSIAPGMYKIDVELLAPRLVKNRDAYIEYIKHTQTQASILRGIVEQTKAFKPLDSSIDFACKYTKHIQELLVHVNNTCPNMPKPSEKMIAITPINKNKVTFADPVTSTRNMPKQSNPPKTYESNKLLFTSTGVINHTIASGSMPTGNTKKNRISRTPRSDLKNKVDEHPRIVNSSLNKKNHVAELVYNANVKHSNVNSDLICATCNECLFSKNHDLCVTAYVNDVNKRSKSKAAKRNKKRKVWKPTRNVFTKIRLKWKPTGRTFTLIGNMCLLTRITSTNVVPNNETINESMPSSKPVTKVYRRRPITTHSVGSGSKSKTIESKISNNSEPNQSWGSTVSDAPSSSLNCKWSKLSSEVATTCYTQNRSIVRHRHAKNPYELLHDRKPDLSYLHVFGALCYPTNDSENLGKLQAKSDIGIFIGYAPKKKAF